MVPESIIPVVLELIQIKNRSICIIGIMTPTAITAPGMAYPEDAVRVMYFVHRIGLNRTAYSKNIARIAIKTAEPIARLKLLRIRIPNSESTTSRQVNDTQ